MSRTIGFTIQARGGTKAINTIKELKDEIKRLNKERENVDRGSNAFKELSSSVASAKSELKRVNDELKQQQRGFEAAKTGAGSYRRLNEELVQARRAVKELSLEELKSASGQQLLNRIQELDKELKDFDATIGQFQRNVGNYPKNSYLGLKNELKEAREAVQRLSVEELKSARGQALLRKIKQLDDQVSDFDQTSRNFGRNLNQYPAGVGRIGASLASLSTVASSVGVSMNLALGPIALAAAGVAGLVAVGGKAVGIYKDFQQEVATLAAISGESAQNIAFLEEQAKQLGESTQFTASQVVQLQTNFARVGFDASEINAATASTLDLAAATGEDLATSAEVAAATLGGYGLGAEETKRVNDIMAQSFNSSALNLERFSESTKLVAPAAKAANVDIETTTAALGALADQGLNGSIAGTALRRIMAEMGTEGSKLSKRLGFTVKNSDDFRKALTQLKAEGVSNADAIALVGRNASSVFGALVNGAPKVGELSEKFRIADEAIDGFDGAAAKAAATVNDTLQGDLLKLQSALEGAAIRFAELGGDGLRRIVQFATTAVPIVTEQLLSITRVFRPVLEAFQSLGVAIQRLGQRFADLGSGLRQSDDAAEDSTQNFNILSSAFQLIAFSIESAINLVEMLVNAFVYLIDEVPMVRNAITNIQKGLAGFMAAIRDIPLVFGGVREVVRQFFENIQNYFEQLRISIDIFEKRTQLLNPFADKSAIKSEIQALKKERQALKKEGFNAGAAFKEGYQKALDARRKDADGLGASLSNANDAPTPDVPIDPADPIDPTAPSGDAKAAKAAEKAAKEAAKAKRDALKLAFEEEKLTLQSQFAERQLTQKQYDDAILALEKQRIEKELEQLELSELERVQLQQQLAQINIKAAQDEVEATETAKREAIETAFEAELETLKTQEAQRLLSKQEADVKLLELEQNKIALQLEQLDLSEKERTDLERQYREKELQLTEATYNAKEAALQRAVEVEKSKLLERLAAQQITEKEYQDALLALEDESLRQRLALAEQYGFETIDLATLIAQREVELNREKNQKLEQDEKDSAQRRAKALQGFADVSQGLISAVADFNEAAKAKELADAGNNAARKEAIERKYAKKQQDTATLQALIQGALGIVKTGANLGYPQAIPLQIAQGIQTLAQVAIIRSKKFADGGYTGRGFDYRDESGQRVAGIVHQDEWVASKRLVRHPVYGAMIRRLEDVQRGRPALQGFAVGGFASRVQTQIQPSFIEFQRNDATPHLIAQNQLLQANIEAVNARLDRLVVVADGAGMLEAATSKDFVSTKYRL